MNRTRALFSLLKLVVRIVHTFGVWHATIMAPNKTTKKRITDYRVQLRLASHIGEKLQEIAERKGIGVLDVIRIAAVEHIERQTPAKTN